MATTVLSLMERVRDLLDDYGSNSTNLAAAVSSTSATSFSVDLYSVAKAGDWATVDGETVEVTAVADGTPDTWTVRRGMRGSTAATHLDDAVCRVNLDFPPQRILNALNLAQDSAYPQLSEIVSDTTLSVVADQYDYALPAALDHVRQVWIETSTADVYNQTRMWDMTTSAIIRLYQTFSTGRAIKVIGTKRFDAMTYSGNLDSLFPDTDLNAIGYLVYEAAAMLVTEQQFPVSKRDGFKGTLDAFAQGAPALSLATGERWHEIAKRYLREATRNIVLPEEVLPDPTRYSLQRV